MACKIQVWTNDGKSFFDCGEPDLIPGVCYDHCVPCQYCGEPVSPHNEPICAKCLSATE